MSDEPDVNEYRHQPLSACQLDACQWHLGGAKGEECITGYSFCYSSADGCGRERLYRLLDSGFELAVCINMSL